MGFFSGMKGEKATRKSDFLNPGKMIVRINRCKLDRKSEQVGGQEYVAVELTVIAQMTAESPAFPVGPNTPLKDGKPYTLPLNRPGQDGVVLFMGDTPLKQKQARANFKGFIMGATGQPEDAIGDEDGDAVVSADNPLGGVFVEVNAIAILTREKKNPFTALNWVRPVPASEVLQLIDPATKAKLYPGDALEKLAAEG
jgi:hypothetical protein